MSFPDQLVVDDHAERLEVTPEPCTSTGRQNMLAQVRCKSAVALCCFVLGIHLLLMVSLNGESMDITSAQVRGRIHSPELVLSRHKRHVDDGLLDDRHGSGARAHPPKGKKNKPNQQNKTHNKSPRDKIAQESDKDLELLQHCRKGHLQAFSPICDSHGCLSKLRLDTKGGAEQSQLPRLDAIPLAVRRQISFIPGWLDGVHFSLVSRLTDMQWESGILGTVGEIGVVEGKFTSVLAFNVDTASGERLFASDIFVSPAESYPGKTQYDVFRQNMEEWGFNHVVHTGRGEGGHLDSSAARVIGGLGPGGGGGGGRRNNNSETKKQVFVHLGTPYDLTKKLFVDLQLPQFRLLSINGDQDAVATLASLEIGSCILRDGGMVVVDGIDTPNTELVPALQQYFKKHGVSTLSPFIAIKNKVYLCTTNWKDRYSSYFVEHQDLLIKYGLMETKDDFFGRTFTYYRR